MFDVIGKVKNHQFLGMLSFLIGFSFVTEQYTITNALRGPIQLAESVLPVYGLHAWGWAFLLGGIFTFISWNIVLRFIALIGASFSWGIFSVASLIATWGFTDPSGSAIGILFLAGLFRCLQSCASIWQDTRKDKSDTPSELDKGS